MHINDIKMMQAEKDYLMRYEGKHPANYNAGDHSHGVDYNSHGVELQ